MSHHVQHPVRRSTWRLLGISGALVIFTLLFSSCGGAQSNTSSTSAATGPTTGPAKGKPIIVGAAVGLTGVMNPYDVPPLTGLEIAAADLNKRGGLLGRPIKVITRDMESNVALGASTAVDVINAGASLLLVSCDPDVGAPGAIAGQTHGVITFSLCEASARFGPQGIGPLAYTASHIDFLEGYVMAEWAFLHQHLRHPFMIVDKTFAAYDDDVCNGFQKRFTELAGAHALVGTDDVSSSDTSIASTITDINAASPKADSVFFCTDTPEGPGWIRQIRAAGVTVPILADSSMDGSYWLSAVPHLSNFYYPAPASIYGDDPNPAVNAFVKEFTARTGHAPPSSYALFGAALLELWSKAVTEAGTTSAPQVERALDSFTNVPTLIGATTFTTQTHIALARPMRIMEIQNGKPSYLMTWQVRKPPTPAG